MVKPSSHVPRLRSHVSSSNLKPQASSKDNRVATNAGRCDENSGRGDSGKPRVDFAPGISESNRSTVVAWWYLLGGSEGMIVTGTEILDNSASLTPRRVSPLSISTGARSNRSTSGSSAVAGQQSTRASTISGWSIVIRTATEHPLEPATTDQRNGEAGRVERRCSTSSTHEIGAINRTGATTSKPAPFNPATTPGSCQNSSGPIDSWRPPCMRSTPADRPAWLTWWKGKGSVGYNGTGRSSCRFPRMSPPSPTPGSCGRRGPSWLRP